MDTLLRRYSDTMIHVVAWCSTLAVALAVGLAAATADDRDPWNGWASARELRQPMYAERIHPERLLRTRANTWSNLGYCLVGFYACGLAARDWRRSGSRTVGPCWLVPSCPSWWQGCW